jgi:hypothetical protein
LKAEDFGLPINEPVSIGSDITITLAEYEGEIVGLTEAHRDKAGNVCMGFVRFEGSRGGYGADNAAKWKVESAKPLTLSPSVLCRSCGNHGFIREGKWVVA